MKNIRYEYLIDSIHVIKPKTIIEIGLAQGLRSYQLIKEAKIFNSEVSFFGYDVFDTKDANWHNMVGNAKKVSSQSEIEKYLEPLNCNIKMHPGMTSETLWLKNNKADIVFIDGDHRIEAIEKDFNSVKESKIIAFDDYYTSGEHNSFSIDKYGCNKLVDSFPANEVYVTPKTLKFPDVRIAFWSKNTSLIDTLKEIFC